jgi:uncharacterized protein (DUF1330 family)
MGSPLMTSPKPRPSGANGENPADTTGFAWHLNQIVCRVNAHPMIWSAPRMTVYVIAQLKFKDRPRYDRYQSRFMDVFHQFDGRLLAADEHPVVLEGASDCDKVVVMSFPSETSARAFLGSPAYWEIAEDRVAGADAIVLLAHGLG